MPGGHAGRLAPGLRIATHNINAAGSRAKLFQLLHLWHSLNIHIVCVQETWVGKHRGSSEQQLNLWLHEFPANTTYKAIWCHNNTQESNAGVAVLIRQDLWDSGAIKVTTLPTSSPTSGRIQQVTVEWAGHVITLVNTYWPNQHCHRMQFLQQTLLPTIAHATPGSVCILGDFNFVHSIAQDRASLCTTTTGTPPNHAAEESAGMALTEQVCEPHQLVDVYRSRHPATRAFTCFRATGAARLDRIYAPQSLAPFIMQCRVYSSPVSDHHPVVVHLLPRNNPPPSGPGLRTIPGKSLLGDQQSAILRDWVANTVHLGLMMTDAQLIRHWPNIKHTLKNQLRHIRALTTTQQQTNTRILAQTRTAVAQATAALSNATAQQLPQAIRTAAVSHQAYSRAAHTLVQPIVAQAAAHWRQQGERPTPAITSFVQPPRPRLGISTLRKPNSHLLTDPHQLTSHTVKHFAAVSARPQCDPQAQARILAALTAEQTAGRSKQIDLGVALQAGTLRVTTDEVTQAITALASGTVAGCDGIPPEAWKICPDLWAPLLAKLYTIIGTTTMTPADFLTGVVCPHYKQKGDPQDINNYRPITLLNTDYRILGAILAKRFSVVLQDVIGPEQTAFLPNRLIGENILFSQLLPAALASDNRQAAMVFLDIAKAYDTLSREFLLDVMRTMGAGPGMCAWVRTMLSNTTATALVNGFQSRPALWTAGVRQGCPLSPVLYLFIAEALACWLRATQTLGVMIAGVRYVSQHFADDTKVLLPNMLAATVAVLVTSLNTYAAATGQHINVSKSALLPLGTTPANVPAAIEGIPVVEHITALGVIHCNTAVPLQHQPHPQQLQQQTHYPLRNRSQAQLRPQRRLQPCHVQNWQPISTAVEKACIRLSGLPLSTMGRGQLASSYAVSKALFLTEFSDLPEAQLSLLERNVQYFVDTGVPHSRPPSLPASRPTRGLCHQLLYGRPAEGGFGLLPLRQHISARHAVWASRLLLALTQPVSRQPQWATIASVQLQQCCPGVHPVAAILMAAYSTTQQIQTGHIPHIHMINPIPAGPLHRMLVAIQTLGPVQQISPLGPQPQLMDVHATEAWLRQPHLDTPAFLATVSSLGWHTHDPTRPLLPCRRTMTVAAVTNHLSARLSLTRNEAHTAYIQQAMDPAPRPTDMPQLLHNLRQSLAAVWKLPWETENKETLWRLAVNGIPGAGGAGICFAHPCPCGFVLTPYHRSNNHSHIHRLHSFWHCPVAAAVREQMQSELHTQHLSRAALWLLQPPAHHINTGVWQVVCNAAVTAMDYGRRRMWSAYIADGRPSPHPRLPAVLQAATAAVQRFWQILLQFADRQAIPPGPAWLGLDTAHPFLASRQPDADQADDFCPLFVPLPPALIPAL